MLTEDKKRVGKIRGNIDMLGGYFKLNLSSAMEYRTSFLIQTFGMFLNNLSFAFFWWLLFERFSSIGGYGFKDVMLLWSFSSAGFGVCFILFGNITRLVEMITQGELDAYLLQPKNVLLNTISSKTNISAWGDLFYGIIIFFLVEGFSFKGSFLFIYFTITGGAIFAGVLIIANSMAFWYGNISSLAGLVFEFLITTSIYPADIFRGIIKFILFTILPAGFISMVPVRLINNFDLKWFLLLSLVSGIWIIISFFVFSKGLKKYESGNLMVQKL